jgi:hypothetical protein
MCNALADLGGVKGGHESSYQQISPPSYPAKDLDSKRQLNEIRFSFQTACLIILRCTFTFNKSLFLFTIKVFFSIVLSFACLFSFTHSGDGFLILDTTPMNQGYYNARP